ncbi:MAG: CoA transferase [Chloroflexi bacterium]|nr:CoA transferase [Chloroflexota bacterium]
MAGVLDGLKVVSMELWVVFSHASVVMADWGADVIKVEPLVGEPSRGLTREHGVSTGMKIGGVELNPGYQLMNRGKKGLAVDLKKDAGRDVLYRLVEQADVFMSNYEVNALKKLKLDYGTLSQLNPRLIYATITGYGTAGPDKDERAYDEAAFWARSGIEYTVTEPGQVPPREPSGMGDRITSILVLAGILGALLNREKTGKGQEVEFSLLQSAAWCISSTIQGALSGQPLRKEPRVKAQNPLSNNYRTKDDRWIRYMMPTSDLFWPDFCRAIGRPELEKDPRFNNMETRRKNCEELIRMLDEIFVSKSIEEWERLSQKHHLLYARVQTPAEVVNDPQALANDFFVDLPHPEARLKVLATPVKFPQNPASVRAPAPEVGQHTEEILLDFGYRWEDIARLKEQGVIL